MKSAKTRAVERALLADRVAREHHERYGWDEPGYPRTWADARRKASFLCRRDLDPGLWDSLGYALDDLQRAIDHDPELVGTPRDPEFGSRAADEIEEYRSIYREALWSVIA